jgi:hypothetical protein
MALTTEQAALLARLNGYNGNGYNITSNPLGFARGGNQAGVFVAALKDVASASDFVATAFVAAETIIAIADEIESGPVVSVNGQTGIVTGLATAAALSSLSDSVETLSDSVETVTTRVATLELADLTARQIALAIAYTGAR